jgi:hypothetical protein
MSDICQKIEIKKIAHTHVVSDITNFTSFADNRYVTLSGDVMYGSLSAPTISTNNLFIGQSSIEDLMIAFAVAL